MTKNGLKVRVALRVPYGLLYAGLVGGCLALVPGQLSSESVTLSTYYPAPSGVYSQMMSSGQTWLARDGGGVGIGTATPPASGLVVMGNVGVGTASASQALQVAGNLSVIGANAAVQFGSNSNALGIAQGSGNWSQDASANDVVLRAAGDVIVSSITVAPTATPAIAPYNFVGIDKPNPTQTLDVGGPIVLAKNRTWGACVEVGYGAVDTAPCTNTAGNGYCGCPIGDYATWTPGLYNEWQEETEYWDPGGAALSNMFTDNSGPNAGTDTSLGMPGQGSMFCCPIPGGVTPL